MKGLPKEAWGWGEGKKPYPEREEDRTVMEFQDLSTSHLA